MDAVQDGLITDQHPFPAHARALFRRGQPRPRLVAADDVRPAQPLHNCRLGPLQRVFEPAATAEETTAQTQGSRSNARACCRARPGRGLPRASVPPLRYSRDAVGPDGTPRLRPHRRAADPPGSHPGAPVRPALPHLPAAGARRAARHDAAGLALYPSILAMLAYLHHHHAVGYERLSRLMAELFALRISEGAIVNALRRVRGTRRAENR